MNFKAYIVAAFATVGLLLMVEEMIGMVFNTPLGVVLALFSSGSFYWAFCVLDEAE